MKRLIFLIFTITTLLTSCSTSDNVIRDDAYYSPYDEKDNANKELAVSNNGTFNTSKISSNSQYDYQKYYSEDSLYHISESPVYEKTETITDTNGVVYTTTEVYYDESYSDRIQKF